jgi:cytochrome c
MTDNKPKTVTLDLELTDEEAWSIAQFFKRASFSDFRRNAQDEDEAYAMRNAASRVRDALARAGYAPR